jgi:hypothetical protein
MAAFPPSAAALADRGDSGYAARKGALLASPRLASYFA